MNASPTVQKATAVLVLGMHRSGTSALAGSLQRLQVPLGAHLVAPWLDNPGGYFEHAGAVTLHESLLAELGRGWESLEPLAEDWLHSPAALHAADALEALIREDFGAARLWALKDPRLSRLLPLWHSVLAKLHIRPAHVFMLRHPDEVAASLQQRDGMGQDYAHLLWLQHYLDAERDTRGHDRTLLTYDSLLGAPVPSLQNVARDLRVRWPTEPSQAALHDILDPSQRHHRAGADRSARGPRAAARELFEAAQAADGSGAAWPRGEPQRQLLARWTERLGPLVSGLGTALARQRLAGQRAVQQCQAFDVALAQAQALSLERLADLQARDARILRDEAVSLARLQELEALGTRLAQTDEALESTEAQSMARLRELEALGTRLAETDEALQATEAQSLARLQELEALGARLAETDEALQATEAQSLARLHELKALGTRLAETDAALQATEAQSLARLGELEALGARLAKTDAALQSIEAQSLRRLEDIASLTERVAFTDAALGEAQTLALDRLQQIASLELSLGATDKALGQAQTLAYAHLRELQSVQGQLDSLQAAATLATTRIRALEAELRQRDDRLQALHDSFAWRLSRPLRWLGRRLGRQGPGWDPT